MKKLFTSFALLTSITALGLSANIINAVKVSDDVSKVDSTSSIWSKAKVSEVMVYPQTTIKFNDKKANIANANNIAKKINVSALTDGKNIAFKVSWPDKTESIQDGKSSVSYPDGFAVQFASNYKEGSKLPYIGMGSKDREVVVYLQKAVSSSYEPNGYKDVKHQVNRSNTNNFNSQIDKKLASFDKKVASLAVKDYQRAFVSEGFRSMTQIKDNSTFFNASMNYEENWLSDNMWEGTISRALKDEYLNIEKEAFPVAFAVWDGEKMGRDGLKHLSSWIVINIDNPQQAQEYQKTIEQDYSAFDIKNGEKLTQTNCSSCHNYANTNQSASPYMAPNLSNIGGYSTSSYLKESIIKPNAVVVPGYNKNAHSNFAWYYTDDIGARTSAMPAFDYLSEKEINDMVAYLKTLKVTKEP